jgi:hypothetical protein
MANSSAFFAILIVLILGVLYVMKWSDNPPETSFNTTPKEYIELVEQKKAAREAAEAMNRSLQQEAERTEQVQQTLEGQR